MYFTKQNVMKIILRNRKLRQNSVPSVLYAGTTLPAQAYQPTPEGVLTFAPELVATSSRWYKVARTGLSSKVVAHTLDSPVKVEDQAKPQIDREARRQGLRMLMGLNNQREGGPVDGVKFEEELRAQW